MSYKAWRKVVEVEISAGYLPGYPSAKIERRGFSGVGGLLRSLENEGFGMVGEWEDVERHVGCPGRFKTRKAAAFKHTTGEYRVVTILK